MLTHMLPSKGKLITNNYELAAAFQGKSYFFLVEYFLSEQVAIKKSNFLLARNKVYP